MPRLVLAAVLVALCSSQAHAAGPYDELLKRAEMDTNAIALIDVKGAYSSPLALSEKWIEKSQGRQGGGLGFVPRDAELVAIAAEINLSIMRRDFQVGMVKVRDVPTMPELAAREGGTADEIAGRLVVLSPRDVYFTTFSGSELVAVYPADRQYTARYIKATMAGKTGQLAPYLRKAADAAGANTVTIAVDLEDVPDKNILRMSLPTSPSVAKIKALDVNLLAIFLSQIKGMTFTAKVTDKIAGSISLAFPGNPGPYRNVLPDLFRELIEGQGVAIAGFENWKAEFTDTTMTLSGALATADLKRIISLFSFPHAPGSPDANEPQAKGNEPTAAATKRYLAAVDAILTDIKKMKDSQNYDKTATWHDKAAAQIEQLSRQQVDPLAVDAARQSANRLRAIGDSLRGVPIDMNALSSQQYYYSQPSVGMYPTMGWWGWRPMITGPNQVDTNIPQIQAEMSKVIANDQKRRQEAWSDIDRILVEARKKLGDKYKMGF